MIDQRECPDCDGYGHNQEPFAPKHKYCETCDRTGIVYACICKGCKKESDESAVKSDGEVYHHWKRSDYNGFHTGYYCDKCYDDPAKYGYRKDNYNDDALAMGESVWGEDEWI